MGRLSAGALIDARFITGRQNVCGLVAPFVIAVNVSDIVADLINQNGREELFALLPREPVLPRSCRIHFLFFVFKEISPEKVLS